MADEARGCCWLCGICVKMMVEPVMLLELCLCDSLVFTWYIYIIHLFMSATLFWPLHVALLFIFFNLASFFIFVFIHVLNFNPYFWAHIHRGFINNKECLDIVRFIKYDSLEQCTLQYSKKSRHQSWTGNNWKHIVLLFYAISFLVKVQLARSVFYTLKL